MPRLINPVPSRIHPLSDLADENLDDRGDLLKSATGLADTTTGTVAATGAIMFSGIPIDGETLTVNGVVFTFKDTVVDPTVEFDIKTDGNTQAAEVASVLNASTDPAVDVATYAHIGTTGTVSVTHDTLGAAGNAFTLAEAATNTSVSGATLTGGRSYNNYASVVKTFMNDFNG